MGMRYNGGEQKDSRPDSIHASGVAGKTWERNIVGITEHCFIFMPDFKFLFFFNSFVRNYEY